MAEAEAKGVVGLFIAPDGRVVAEVLDFDNIGYGGFTLAQAQRIRCKNALNREVVNRFAGPPLAEAISEYHAKGIVDSMIDKQGYRKHFITIGHDEDESNA